MTTTTITIQQCPFCAYFGANVQPTGAHAKIGEVPACDDCAEIASLCETADEMLDWLEAGGNAMTTTYELRYDPPHGDQEETVNATSLDQLISLIGEHVIHDDYCWITILVNGAETGKGQYYRSECPDMLLEAIEECDAANGLRERVNWNAAQEAISC